MLPPYWSFAPWIGRDYHRNDGDVRGDMEKTRSLGLSSSVILIDSPRATGYQTCPNWTAHAELSPARWSRTLVLGTSCNMIESRRDG
jgi:hypothetical protein